MKRLEAIAGEILPCKVFADIGCDHGIIGLYAVKNHLADKVCECDIGEECLFKARSLIGDGASYLLSVLHTASVTPEICSLYMLRTALHPPPPTPITFMMLCDRSFTGSPKSMSLLLFPSMKV